MGKRRALARIIRARRSACVISVLFFSLTPWGCERAPESAERPRGNVVILIGPAAREPTWPVAIRAADSVEQARPWVRIERRAPEEASPVAVYRILDELTPQPGRTLCIWPCDVQAVRSRLSALSDAGLPVVLLGRDLPDCGRAAFAGVGEREIGEALAGACLRLLPADRPTIGLLHAAESDRAQAERRDAFRAALAQDGRGEILREVDCSGRELESRRMLAGEVARYPRMGAWVLLDDWPMRGAPLGEAFAPAGTPVVLYSAGATALERLRAGTVAAVVTCDHRRMFERGLAMAAELARGKELPNNEEWVAPITLTRADVDRFPGDSSAGPAAATSGPAEIAP